MSDAAKEALDKIIKKTRIHFYKPTQIAETLHYHRLGKLDFDITNLESYRNASKAWRDNISSRLVGRVSTSSQKYQDNLFDDNAMPPHLLKILAKTNEQNAGLVENYIYHRFKQRLQDVIDAYTYLKDSSTDTFSLKEFLNYFERKSGLKRSVDKAFEIVVYALFSTLVQELKAEVTLSLNNPDKNILIDFEKFVEHVLGLNAKTISLTAPANIYRGGVTNAADRGLDLLTNFGPAIQVKHLQLNEKLAEDISESTMLDDIIIVCKTADAAIIQSLLSQIGFGIRGIITQDDLEDWYSLCQTKYTKRMGEKLLKNLALEFVQEFPVLDLIDNFLKERNYKAEDLTGEYTF